MESKRTRYFRRLTAGEYSQLGHYATDSSSMVARMVGLAEKPRSARLSPSRCRLIASRMLIASAFRVAACVTTGRSRHSATKWRSPLVIRTWIVRLTGPFSSSFQYGLLCRSNRKASCFFSIVPRRRATPALSIAVRWRPSCCHSLLLSLPLPNAGHPGSPSTLMR